MGSRAVVVVCRDEPWPARRFGVPGAGLGVIYTRTGRRVLRRPGRRAGTARAGSRRRSARPGLWAELGTDWLVLDCELLPWSAKAGELLRGQYAPVGAAATATLDAETPVLAAAGGARRGRRPACCSAAGSARRRRRGSWPPTAGTAGPSARSTTSSSRRSRSSPARARRTPCATTSGTWTCSAGCATATPPRCGAPGRSRSGLGDEASERAATAWWEELTAAGGEGMVVKPADVVHRGPKGLAQPGIKCRGPEYLRIIYGPEYTAEPNLTGCAPAASATSGRWPCASSPSASRRWSVRRPASRCTGCTVRVRRAGPRKRARGPQAVTGSLVGMAGHTTFRYAPERG